jgi:hypothetical protein
VNFSIALISVVVSIISTKYLFWYMSIDRLCGLVVGVPGYRSRGPGSIPGATRFFLEVVDLKRGPLSLAIATEELLERKIAASV